jgi:hypothetical protein
VAQELLNVNTDVWNALKATPIRYDLYSRARRQIFEKNLLRKFVVAMRADLGTVED